MSRDDIVNKSKSKDPPFKVGDKVVRERGGKHGGLDEGDYGIVSEVFRSAYKDTWCIKLNDTRNEVVFDANNFDLVVETPAPVEFKDGERVKIKGNSNGHCYRIGETVTLNGKSSAYKTWGTGRTDGWLKECDFELIPEVVDIPVPAKFKTGDKVKIIKCRGGHCYKVGDTTILSGKKSTTGQWESKTTLPNRWIYEDEMEFISETEIVLNIVDKPKEHTAYVTFVSSSKEYAYQISDKIVEILRGKVKVKLGVDVHGERKIVDLVSIKENYLDPKVTKEIQCVEECHTPEPKQIYVDPSLMSIGITKYPVSSGTMKWPTIMYPDLTKDGIHPDDKWRKYLMCDWFGTEVFNDVANKSILNNKEESKMSKRRVVNIQLLDNDAGLPVEFSHVASWENVVTEDSNEVTIQEIISTGEVANFLKAHNETRAEQVNLDILNRTGNEVNLRPIKLKDLTWDIK